MDFYIHLDTTVHKMQNEQWQVRIGILEFAW